MKCAVWYVSHFSLYYSVLSDEMAAARFALNMQDDGSGAVLGVQFADGHQFSRDEWALLETENTRRTREAIRNLDEMRKRPPRPVRHVRSPFHWAYDSETIEIDADEPGWLGAE